MNMINYILQGFGFQDWNDFKLSAFGFILDEKVVNIAAIIGFLASLTKEWLGISHLFYVAFCVLIIFEWVTGIVASFKRNEVHQSRKLGRMLLKIATYTVLIYILNTFKREVEFPIIIGYEIDPFIWLYWIVLTLIIWQLMISLLENLSSLGHKWAIVAIKVINKRFYNQLDIND